MFQVENRLNCPWRGPGQHFTVKTSNNQLPHPLPTRMIKGVFDFRSFLALFRLPAKCPKNHPIFLKFLQ